MTFEEFKKACALEVSKLKGYPVSSLEPDDDQLLEFYEDGESPFNVAMEATIGFEEE